jgi:hypothetical protein
MSINPTMHDAFISYRRNEGGSIARLLKEALEKRGKSVFLDVDDLGSGHFNEALLKYIENAPNFIVVLTPGSLDRCRHPDDWLRREITHAIETGRNIIPVMIESFVFPPPDELADEIRPIVTHNAVPYSHAYFSAAIDKLVGYLKNEDALQALNDSEIRMLTRHGAADFSRGKARHNDLTRKTLLRLFMQFVGAHKFTAMALSLIAIILSFSIYPLLKWRPWSYTAPESEKSVLKTEASASFSLSPELEHLNEALSYLEDIEGMCVNTLHGTLLIIGRPGIRKPAQPLFLEDLAFAFSWAAEKEQRPFGCRLELPNKNSSKWQFTVEYYGGVERTHVGFGLCSADLALKEYALGTRINGKPIQSSVVAYPAMLRNLDDRVTESRITGARFWFRMDPCLRISSDGTLATIETTGVSVGYEGYKWQEGEFRPCSVTDESLRNYSKFFSEHFDQFAEEAPSLAWLRRFASVVALAKWSETSDILAQMNWIGALAKKPYETATSIKMIVTPKNRTNRTTSGEVVTDTIQITGGLSIESIGEGNKKIKGSNEYMHSIMSNIPKDIHKAKVGSIIEIDTFPHRYVCIVVHSAGSAATKLPPNSGESTM